MENLTYPEIAFAKTIERVRNTGFLGLVDSGLIGPVKIKQEKARSRSTESGFLDDCSWFPKPSEDL